MLGRMAKSLIRTSEERVEKNLEKEMEMFNMIWTEMEKKAQDHVVWRGIVGSICSSRN